MMDEQLEKTILKLLNNLRRKVDSIEETNLRQAVDQHLADVYKLIRLTK